MTTTTFWWLVIVTLVLVVVFIGAATDISSLEDKVTALQTAVATATP